MALELAFNIALTLAAAAISWFIRALFTRMEKMEQADADLAKAVNELRNSLPDRYVRRDDHKEALDAIFALLRRIEDKVDGKADKP